EMTHIDMNRLLVVPGAYAKMQDRTGELRYSHKHCRCLPVFTLALQPEGGRKIRDPLRLALEHIAPHRSGADNPLAAMPLRHQQGIIPCHSRLINRASQGVTVPQLL